MTMEHFTPISALVGGALIGTAALLLWVLDGRIAGISGILGGLGQASRNDVGWRIAFLTGLIAAPMAYGVFMGRLPSIAITPSVPLLIVAGLLVGFGTRLGSGCTSGHGVCGVARLSTRSLIATGTFMAAGALTVFLVHHVFA
jgi:uncharacterized membrane protein YedE/YeeE